MKLRDYQQRVIDQLFAWWETHSMAGIPICVMPTGSGKSVVIAALVREFFTRWPEHHPRTLVLVPSKELCEQNAEKLRAMLPPSISVGIYSAAIGRRDAHADVIVATIGSVYKAAHRLGNIKAVLIDECHLVRPDGADAGRYRQLLTSLSQFCRFCTVGFTATPFRGNGVLLTEGEDALFSEIAVEVSIRELIEGGYLAPFSLPQAVKTRIDTTGVSTSNGDYNVGQLNERVLFSLPEVADEVCAIAAERKKWIAFLPAVSSAESFVRELIARGIPSALVCGDTPKFEREAAVAAFREGRLRCMVTVIALATGFDVPDVDCVLWLRPTISPVLYVQGAGRGMRPAPGKTDCLWVDFTDTTQRMGPIDAIRGRSARPKLARGDPRRICPSCGNENTLQATRCWYCSEPFERQHQEFAASLSDAPILSSMANVETYPVGDVIYRLHHKLGKPDSVRVDYWCGLSRVASEWLCFGHEGMARKKAVHWWRERVPGVPPPSDAHEAIAMINEVQPRRPKFVVVRKFGKYPEIVEFIWGNHGDGNDADTVRDHVAQPAQAVGIL
jgi:DNA repair protein RadD